jgi:hypothetical protein
MGSRAHLKAVLKGTSLARAHSAIEATREMILATMAFELFRLFSGNIAKFLRQK